MDLPTIPAKAAVKDALRLWLIIDDDSLSHRALARLEADGQLAMELS